MTVQDSYERRLARCADGMGVHASLGRLTYAIVAAEVELQPADTSAVRRAVDLLIDSDAAWASIVAGGPLGDETQAAMMAAILAEGPSLTPPAHVLEVVVAAVRISAGRGR